ncbi:MAG: 4Fe-4S dicluster domain-containing protein [Anaerolineales bacterium]
MPQKDLYEDLIRYYEFQMGTMPRRQAFKEALRETFPDSDLRIFFQLPYLGFISEDKFLKKLAKKGINKTNFDEALTRLIPRGLIDKFQKDGEWGYERAPVIVVLEMAVREREDSQFRAITAAVMDDMIEGAAEAIPTKTPYYRVLPVEETVQPAPQPRLIQVNEDIDIPNQVLPLDVISEMMKSVDLIAVSNCYCRSAKQVVGDPCDHPLETCFYFDELAQMKLQTDYARELDYQEAMEILYECEAQGLVHNVSNCEGKIQTLCNCCECSCAVLKAWSRGMRNTTSPSRYLIHLDPERCTLEKDCLEACPVSALQVIDEELRIDEEVCLGCGLCIPSCPQGALSLQIREAPPKVYKDNDALFRKIYAESAVGLIGRKLGLGK